MCTQLQDFSILPQEVLDDIVETYENALVAKIQRRYATYKGWRCKVCRRAQPRHRLVLASACEKFDCCKKLVCRDPCVFRCSRGHVNLDTFWQDVVSAHCERFEVKYEKMWRKCSTCDARMLIFVWFAFDEESLSRLPWGRVA